jgi:hypothetical protein
MVLLSHEEEWNFIFHKMELQDIILIEFSKSQKTKIVCSLSYVDFRSRANAAMLLDLGHMLREEYIPEEWG